MKKEKLIWLSHNEKVWWARVPANNISLGYLNKILLKYDPQEYGLEIDPIFDSKLDYPSWKNRGFDFFTDNECGYLFFMEKEIHVLLFKDSKLFEKLKDEFLKYFKFLK